jgi:hypothetical protein
MEYVARASLFTRIFFFWLVGAPNAPNAPNGKYASAANNKPYTIIYVYKILVSLKIVIT